MRKELATAWNHLSLASLYQFPWPIFKVFLQIRRTVYKSSTANSEKPFFFSVVSKRNSSKMKNSVEDEVRRNRSGR